MKTTTKTNNRVAIIAGVAALVLLIVAGALYAQGANQGNGGQGRGWGMHQGQGMGRGMRQGQGGMRQGQGRRGGHMGAMAYLMQDPDIRSMMGEIRVISSVNKVGLNHDQVTTLLDCSKQAQDIISAKYGASRDQMKSALQDQLTKVLGGAEFDRSALKAIGQQAKQGNDQSGIRDQMKPIIEKALGVLTDDQKTKFMEPGPMAQQMKERMQNSPMAQQRQQRMQNMTEEQKQQMQARRGNAKMMMLLMNPNTPDALQKWLDANK